MIVRRQKRQTKKWIFGGLLILAVIAVAGTYFAAKQLEGQAVGSSSSVTLNAPLGQQVTSFDSTPVQTKGAYVSFSYPKSFNIDTPNPTDSIDVANYRYKYRAENTWQLAVAIEHLPSPSLKNDSGYVYRTLHPEKYQASTESVGGRTYIIMTDTSQPGFNKVAYTDFHGNLMGIVALTGYESAGSRNLNTTFDMVLGSWLWL